MKYFLEPEKSEGKIFIEESRMEEILRQLKEEVKVLPPGEKADLERRTQEEVDKLRKSFRRGQWLRKHPREKLLN